MSATQPRPAQAADNGTSATTSATSLPGSPSSAGTATQHRTTPSAAAAAASSSSSSSSSQLQSQSQPSSSSSKPPQPPVITDGIASPTFPPSPRSPTLAVPTRPGQGRHRSSSLLTVERVKDSHDVMLDQNAGFNANADWVNHKGAWVVHIVLILTGKILVDVVPGITQDISWTIVNLGYMALTFLMFHHVTGTPFEANAGAYDELTLWEQIDEGAQHTPAKKWLTSVPIGLFLISTHYTKYNLWLFTLNFCALLFVLFPKLPILDRLRFKVLPAHFSGPPTPNISRAPTPISRTGTPVVGGPHSGRKSPRPF
ncbi:sphingolipid homeostasis protein orm1 [Tilletia horrida]|nr:sphingolipid homeostasis protein orm1 [Tilletia horrida]